MPGPAATRWRDPCEQGNLQGNSPQQPRPQAHQAGATCLKFPVISALRVRIRPRRVETGTGKYQVANRECPRAKQGSGHRPQRSKRTVHPSHTSLRSLARIDLKPLTARRGTAEHRLIVGGGLIQRHSRFVQTGAALWHGNPNRGPNPPHF